MKLLPILFLLSLSARGQTWYEPEAHEPRYDTVLTKVVVSHPLCEEEKEYHLGVLKDAERLYIVEVFAVRKITFVPLVNINAYIPAHDQIEVIKYLDKKRKLPIADLKVRNLCACL